MVCSRNTPKTLLQMHLQLLGALLHLLDNCPEGLLLPTAIQRTPEWQPVQQAVHKLAANPERIGQQDCARGVLLGQLHKPGKCLAAGLSATQQLLNLQWCM
jgi:hypothetical protein